MSTIMSVRSAAILLKKQLLMHVRYAVLPGISLSWWDKDFTSFRKTATKKNFTTKNEGHEEKLTKTKFLQGNTVIKMICLWTIKGKC
nr:hypothetical protein [Candidatus Kuenenia stuttgartiensis]